MSDAKKHKPGTRRRTFLKTGLLAGTGIAVGFPVVRVGLWWNRRPGDGLKALSDREYEIADAMAEAYFPPGGNPPQSGKELNLALFLDEQIAAMDDDLQRVMKAGLHTIQDVTIVDTLNPMPFHKLPLERRQQILEEWANSAVFAKRGLLRMMKWYFCMALCEMPGMLEQLEIDYLCS